MSIIATTDLMMMIALAALLVIGQRLAGSRRFSKRLLSSLFNAVGLFGLIVSVSVVVLRALRVAA